MHSQSNQRESKQPELKNREWNEWAGRPWSGRPWRRIVAALALATAAFVAAPALAQEAPAESAESAEQSADLVNIQTASEQELQSLPGIGPSKAAAIVAYRERRPFRSIREIMRVRGIGRATFRRLRPLITVEGDS